jgi:hypothetical protein
LNYEERKKNHRGTMTRGTRRTSEYRTIEQGILNDKGEGRATKTPRTERNTKKRSFGGEGIKLIVMERNKVIFRSHLMNAHKRNNTPPGVPATHKSTPG